MKNHSFPRRAPGGPGIEPRWTHGAKVAVGTAYSTSSRVWYTLDAGCVTEVYYPVDPRRTPRQKPPPTQAEMSPGTVQLPFRIRRVYNPK